MNTRNLFKIVGKVEAISGGKADYRRPDDAKYLQKNIPLEDLRLATEAECIIFQGESAPIRTVITTHDYMTDSDKWCQRENAPSDPLRLLYKKGGVVFKMSLDADARFYHSGE